LNYENYITLMKERDTNFSFSNQKVGVIDIIYLHAGKYLVNCNIHHMHPCPLLLHRWRCLAMNNCFQIALLVPSHRPSCATVELSLLSEQQSVQMLKQQ
jgi:hypothetical protein